MKPVTILAAFFSFLVIGCGHKEVYVAPDGSSAVVNKDANGSVQVNSSDNKGNSVSENIGKDGTAHIDATNKDGTNVSETISKDGVSMTDSKGESMTMAA